MNEARYRYGKRRFSVYYWKVVKHLTALLTLVLYCEIV